MTFELSKDRRAEDAKLKSGMMEGKKNGAIRSQRKAWLIGIFFIAAVLVFSILADEVVREKEDWFDTRVFNFFKATIPTQLMQSFLFITSLGSSTFLLCAYIFTVLYLLFKKQKGEALIVGVTAIISEIILFVLKNIFSRTRPDLPFAKPLTNFSFPSGHASSSFVFCSLLVWLITKSSMHKAWKAISIIFLTILVMLVGVSRIVLRYHYASDVVAGFCLGIGCVAILLVAERIFFNKQ